MELPVVNYLVLDSDGAHLEAQECETCGARYLERRMACARCGKRKFVSRRLSDRGTIGSFTIVHRAAKTVHVPFASAIVDLDDGTTVKANVLGCDPDPGVIRLGLPVRLRTFEAGADDNGTVAIAFGYEPDVAPTGVGEGKL